MNTIYQKTLLIPTWEEIAHFLIEVAKSHPIPNPSLLTEEFRVQGCSIKTWVDVRVSPDQNRVLIESYSESYITWGLMLLLEDYIKYIPLENISKVHLSDFAHLQSFEVIIQKETNFFAALIEDVHIVASEIVEVNQSKKYHYARS